MALGSLCGISCSSVSLTTQETNCIAPPPICRPGSFSEVGIDTSLLYPGNYKYSLEPLHSPINTSDDDNSIAFLKKNDALFAFIGSSRAKDAETRAGVQTVFSVIFKGLYSFSEPKPLVKRKEILVYGSPCYCPQDDKLYFSSKAPNEDPNDFDLYSASIDFTGSEPNLHGVTRLDKLSREFSFDSHPTLSKDGLILYFASDRPGGFGGLDIWYAKRSSPTSNDWSLPEDCPKAINTPCDEITPSVSRDNTLLYFSSNGHQTVGGYDIFSSKISGGDFGEAHNLGKELNTPFDEIFPYDLNDSLFFFTSNEPAPTKGRNIFALHRTQLSLEMVRQFFPKDKQVAFDPVNTKVSPDEIAHIEAIKDTSPITVQGKVRVANDTSRTPTDATVFWRDAKKNVEVGRKKVDSSGDYSIQMNRGKEYDLGAESKEKFYDVQRIDLRNVKDSVITVPTLHVPDTLLLRINFPSDDHSHPYEFTINDEGKQSPMSWQTSLDLITSSIKQENQKLHSVLLSGHTDSLGTDAYNFALAQRRAEFIASELIARGIPKKLLKIVSKGKTMPVRRRAGETDEMFYLRCRRVEFVKIFK